jgi:hypothetical protein
MDDFLQLDANDSANVRARERVCILSILNCIYPQPWAPYKSKPAAMLALWYREFGSALPLTPFKKLIRLVRKLIDEGLAEQFPRSYDSEMERCEAEKLDVMV